MAIWLKSLIVAVLALSWVPSDAQELLKVPVQIPSITPAATAFAVARERGYYHQEGLDVQLIVMASGLGTQATIGGNVKFPLSAEPGCCQFYAEVRCDLSLPPSIDPCFGFMRDRRFGRWQV
jgi:ABC-type nitrate/sulfonate/bicarbonate transport system substrate-binding protein